MIARLLSQKLALLVIGLAAGRANNAVTSAKIKDGEVKAPDIATAAVGESEIAANSVGASELKGVSRLIFLDCDFSAPLLSAGASFGVFCPSSAAQLGDNVVATNNSSPCMPVANAFVDFPGVVKVWLRNVCSSSLPAHTGTVSVIVFQQ